MHNSHNKWLILPLFFLLIACGGGSKSNDDTDHSESESENTEEIHTDAEIDAESETDVNSENEADTEETTSNNPINPAEGLVANDLTLRPKQAIDKPAYLQTIVDPSFGTTIRRITNAGAGNAIKPMYSTIQAWNADETFMILYDQSKGVHQLLNGHTYAFIRNLDDIAPDDIEQVFWDYENPDHLYYVDRVTGELIRYSVSAKNKQVLADLATLSSCNNYDVSLGNDVQMMSYDSDVFGFRCGNDAAYSYTVSTDKLTTFSMSDVQFLAPMSAPSGKLFFHHTTVYGTDGIALHELNKNGPEHESLGRLGNGNDALFSVEFDAGPHGGCDGNIIAHDLTTGKCFDVISQRQGYDYAKTGTHISALAHQNPGWIAASLVGYQEDGKALLDQELVLVNVHDKDNVDVYRIGHHRADENEFNYWGEPHAVISPTGTRVLFGSDWSGEDDGHSVDSYVVELPAYRSP